MQYSTGVKSEVANQHAFCVCDAAVQLAPRRKYLTLTTSCDRCGQSRSKRKLLRRPSCLPVPGSRAHSHMCAHTYSVLHSILFERNCALERSCELVATTAAADTLSGMRIWYMLMNCRQPLAHAKGSSARSHSALHRTQVPWFAAAVFAISGAAAGMGAWLLFSLGDASTHMLAANLPLVVSVLWAAAHCATASVTLWFALGLRRRALGAVATVNEVGASLHACQQRACTVQV